MATSAAFGNVGAQSIAFSTPPSASGVRSPYLKKHSYAVSVKKPSLSTGSFKKFSTAQHNTFTGSDNPYGGIHFSSPGALTPQEAFALGYQKRHGSGSGSFLDSAKHFGGSLLSDALNVISRPNWAMADAYDQATKHGGFSFSGALHGAEAGITGRSHETFGDIIRRRHPHMNGLLASAAGLGLDVVTDPTTYLFGVGALGDIGKFGLKAGLSDLEKQGAAKLVGNEMKPLAEGATAAEKAAHDSATVLHNRLEDLKYKNARNKYLELRVGPTKRFSVGIQTPLQISKSKDAKLAAMEAGTRGPLGKIKDALGESFVPGYKNPIGHVIENHVGHHVERAGDVMMQEMLHHLRPGHQALPDAMQGMKALLAGTVPGAVKHGRLQEDVLVHALQKQGFNSEHDIQKALTFLHSFHDAGRALLERDRAAGLSYKDVGAGENGIMYVPHVYEKGAQTASIVKAQSVLGHQGFENAKKLTLEQAMKMHAAGHGKNLIMDPIELMARRVHAGAMGQAQEIMRHYVRQNFAEPDKVLGSLAHVNKAMGRVARLHKEVQALHEALDTHGSLHNARRRLRYAHGRERLQLEKTLKGIKKRDIATRNGKYREFAAERNDLAKMQAELRSRVAEAGRKHTKQESALLARMQRRINNLEQGMREHESMAVMKKRQIEELNALGVQHATRANELQTAIDQRMKTLAKIEPKAVRKAFVKNPALKEKQLLQIDNLKTKQDLNALRAKVGDKTDYEMKLAEVASLKENGKGLTINYHVPPEIHAAVTRVDAVLSNPEAMTGVMRVFRKALSKWKLYVTMANPGYGLRNTLSDMWNAYIMGMPLHAIPRYAAKAVRLLAAAKKGDAKAIATLDHAAYHGIMTGFYNTDIREALRGGVKASKLNLVRHMTSANIARENGGRLAHYLYQLDQGMSEEAAAAHIRAAHFDYTDLTPFEQKHMKNIAPFYTWTRKNVPLQLQQLISRPGRYAAYEKFANESEQGTGVSPGELASTVFQSHPMAFKTPFGYFDPNVGISDLARISSPSQLLQMVNPAIQVPLEIGFNRDFFTGDAITGPNAPHQLTPAPGLLADILGPLGLSGETGRVVHGGKEVHSPGINNLAALIMDQVPLGSEIMSHNALQDQKQAPFAKLGGFSLGPRDVSYGVGLSFTRPDQQEEQMIASLNAANAQKAALKAEREAGKFPAAKRRKKSAFEKEMLALIQRQMGR